jgi:hypothetical protein
LETVSVHTPAYANLNTRFFWPTPPISAIQDQQSDAPPNSPMSSNAGRSHNQAHETPTAQYLSPSPDDITPLEEVSDVESFSRTRPEESEEEDELDIEAPGVDGASRNGVTKEDGGNDSPLQLPSSTRHIGEATQGSNGNDPYFPNQSVGVSHPQSTLSAQVVGIPCDSACDNSSLAGFTIITRKQSPFISKLDFAIASPRQSQTI